MTYQEGPLFSILSRLSVDTIYRLLINILVRKITKDQRFWRLLIENSLGIVPKFQIDLKLYYLRATEFPIAGRIWKSENGKGWSDTGFPKKVIKLFAEDRFVTRDGELHWGTGRSDYREKELSVVSNIQY